MSNPDPYPWVFWPPNVTPRSVRILSHRSPRTAGQIPMGHEYPQVWSGEFVDVWQGCVPNTLIILTHHQPLPCTKSKMEGSFDTSCTKCDHGGIWHITTTSFTWNTRPNHSQHIPPSKMSICARFQGSCCLPVCHLHYYLSPSKLSICPWFWEQLLFATTTTLENEQCMLIFEGI